MNDKIEDIYDELPDIDCQGHCHESCGPVAYSDAEEKRMMDAGDEPPAPRTFGMTCDKLTRQTKQCSIYENRPLICRMWGVVEGLPCTFGCKPKGGYMSDARARQLIEKMDKIKIEK